MYSITAIAKSRKQLKYPSVEWINELSIFIQTIEIKINELLLCAMILMNHSHKYNAGQKKKKNPDIKEYIMHDSIYIKFRHRQN